MEEAIRKYFERFAAYEEMPSQKYMDTLSYYVMEKNVNRNQEEIGIPIKAGKIDIDNEKFSDTINLLNSQMSLDGYRPIAIVTENVKPWEYVSNLKEIDQTSIQKALIETLTAQFPNENILNTFVNKGMEERVDNLDDTIRVINKNQYEEISRQFFEKITKAEPEEEKIISMLEDREDGYNSHELHEELFRLETDINKFFKNNEQNKNSNGQVKIEKLVLPTEILDQDNLEIEK